MKWFDNPRKRRRSTSSRRKARSRRKPPKGFKSWKSWSRAMRARIGKKGGSMARRKRSKSRSRSRRRSSRRRGSSRRIAIVRHPVLVNPRRRGRRYRRNPGRRGFSVQGLMRQAIDGAQDALWIVGGKAVTNALPNLVGLSPVGALGIAVKAAAALGAGFIFGFVSQNAAKLATAAGFAAIIEPIVKGLNIPIISPALAADDGYDSLAAYPEEVPALSAYPNAGVGAYPDDYAMQY